MINAMLKNAYLRPACIVLHGNEQQNETTSRAIINLLGGVFNSNSVVVEELVSSIVLFYSILFYFTYIIYLYSFSITLLVSPRVFI